MRDILFVEDTFSSVYLGMIELDFSWIKRMPKDIWRYGKTLIQSLDFCAVEIVKNQIKLLYLLMEKEFVHYELALRMKQLGYKKEGVDEDCFAFYDEEEYLFTVREQDDIDEEWLIAPTFSQAFRWFREKYGLFSSEVYDRGLDNGKLPIIHSYSFRILNLNNFEDFYGDTFDIYEEAELACLEKLIEIVEQTNAEMTDHGVYK